jgi:hypothetical protein
MGCGHGLQDVQKDATGFLQREAAPSCLEMLLQSGAIDILRDNEGSILLHSVVVNLGYMGALNAGREFCFTPKALHHGLVLVDPGMEKLDSYQAVRSQLAGHKDPPVGSLPQYLGLGISFFKLGGKARGQGGLLDALQDTRKET